MKNIVVKKQEAKIKDFTKKLDLGDCSYVYTDWDAYKEVAKKEREEMKANLNKDEKIMLDPFVGYVVVK